VWQEGGGRFCLSIFLTNVRVSTPDRSSIHMLKCRLRHKTIEASTAHERLIFCLGIARKGGPDRRNALVWRRMKSKTCAVPLESDGLALVYDDCSRIRYEFKSPNVNRRATQRLEKAPLVDGIAVAASHPGNALPRAANRAAPGVR
jgi:hypothetical protein